MISSDLERTAVSILTVTELNQRVHELLEGTFPELWVEGEISNWKTYPSGHSYFTLKDADSQIHAVLFRGAAQHLRFTPEDGLKTLARARLSSYVKRGEVQLIVSILEPRAMGALKLAFEQLKAKLAKEGLFDESRKKPIPPFPEEIGIVTSLAGAALRDILAILNRRFENLHILIYPVTVQGDAAKDEIAQAIEDLNRHLPELDVLLVGRGGGSLEDLWAFNEEVVARSIAASKIPIISCVGHETDFTIADFVADLRAPTPSAAAELVVANKEEVLEHLKRLRERLSPALSGLLRRLGERLAYVAKSPYLTSPHRIYEDKMKEVDELFDRLFKAMRERLAHATKDFHLYAEKLGVLSPLNILSRGYAIAWKLPEEHILRSSKEAGPGDSVRLRLHQGELVCEVKKAS